MRVRLFFNSFFQTVEPHLTYPHPSPRTAPHDALPHMPRTRSGPAAFTHFLPRSLAAFAALLLTLRCPFRQRSPSFFIASCSASTCATRSLSSRPSTSRSSPQRRPWTWYDICPVAYRRTHTKQADGASVLNLPELHFVCALCPVPCVRVCVCYRERGAPCSCRVTKYSTRGRVCRPHVYVPSQTRAHPCALLILDFSSHGPVPLLTFLAPTPHGPHTPYPAPSVHGYIYTHIHVVYICGGVRSSNV